MASSIASRHTWAGYLVLGLLVLGCGSNDVPSAKAGDGKGGTAENAAGALAMADGGTPTSSGGTSGIGGKSSTGGNPASTTENADCAHDGDGRTTLVFVNGCSSSISFRGSDTGGGELAPGAASCVDIGSDVESLSAKRYWGFRGEDPGAEHHSLAEFTFNTDFNDFDWYNISYVDAFNLPLEITPLARPKCQALSCPTDFLPNCPSVGRYQDSHGNVVACVSPERNDAMSPVALYFEACDDAYAWSGDDQKGDDPSPVRACAGEDFQIKFCPGAR